MRKKVAKNILQPSIRKYDKGSYFEYIHFHGRHKEGTGENTNKLINDKWLSNLSRMRKNIKGIIHNNINFNSCMITLTYAENIQDYDLSQKNWNSFLKRIKRNIEPDLRYLAVMELQQRGAIHYHIIIFNDSIYNLDNEDIAKLWGHGFTYKKNIDDIDEFTIDKLSNYLGKYLSSAGEKSQLIDKHKKMYFTSRNLYRERPKEIDYLYSNYIIFHANINLPVSNDLTRSLISKENDKKLILLNDLTNESD